MKRDDASEGGAILILVVVFVLVVGLVSAGLLSLSTTNMVATSRLQALRNVDYGADAAMAFAITSLRTSTTEGYPLAAASCSFPSATNPAPPTTDREAFRVDCYTISSPPPPEFEREVVLEVCPGSDPPGPCDGVTNTVPPGSPLRATVTFYDFPQPGSAVVINSWSAVR
jgi:hypothetical protein